MLCALYKPLNMSLRDILMIKSDLSSLYVEERRLEEVEELATAVLEMREQVWW